VILDFGLMNVTVQLLFNGHAGAGLGELLIAASLAALAVTILIFRAMYRSRPSSGLRILGLVYAVSIVGQLAVFLVLSPNLAFLTCWYVLGGFVFACFLGLIYLMLGSDLE
jgi:hypothetical protein